MGRRAGAGLIGVALAILLSPAAPAAARGVRTDCADPGERYQPVSWSQRLLAPERVWPFSRGTDITVAVISSGVDANHAQLRGRVDPGFDAVTGQGSADTDCLGLGTQAAGMIAARATAGVGFVGLAPNARILPVRVLAPASFGAAEVDPAVLARGITWAADNGAEIIDIAVAIHEDDPGVREAVAHAVFLGIPVIAAVGDLTNGQGSGVTSYPAAYPNVVGVGAIDENGRRWEGSPSGDFVDLVAPGAGVVTLQRVRGVVRDASGTGIASAAVAGTAALVRSRRGDLRASEIAKRMFATATPAPPGPDYGHGIVNPYAAVTDSLAGVDRTPLPTLVRPDDQADTAWRQARTVGLIGTVVAALLVLAVLAVAAAIPRGRRRFWRAGLAARPPVRPEPSEPGPPVQLFEERDARSRS
jgi:type VII secretion-associated serine protease mycosin